MPIKLSSLLKHLQRTDGVAPTVREYENSFEEVKRGGLASRQRDYKAFINLYYDLATDFYEYGWGTSFHFAPRVPGESFKASLARHEHFLALKLGLRPGMVVADLGCGIGGPLVEIARFSGAKIVGINNNTYQLERARRLTEEAEQTHLAEFLQCDFPARRCSRRVLRRSLRHRGNVLCTGQTQHLWRDLSSTEAGRALRRVRVLHDRPLRREQSPPPQDQGRHRAGRRPARYRRPSHN